MLLVCVKGHQLPDFFFGEETFSEQLQFYHEESDKQRFFTCTRKSCKLFPNFACLCRWQYLRAEEVGHMLMKTHRPILIQVARSRNIKWNFIPWLSLLVEPSLHFGLEGVGKVQWWFNEKRQSRDEISLRSAAEPKFFVVKHQLSKKYAPPSNPCNDGSTRRDNAREEIGHCGASSGALQFLLHPKVANDQTFYKTGIHFLQFTAQSRMLWLCTWISHGFVVS